MIRLPLTLEVDRDASSPWAQVLEALDSPAVFYLVFVLPFLLLAVLFHSPRRYAWTFGESGITVRTGKIITQRIARERIAGIDAVEESGAVFLRVRWRKRGGGPVHEVTFPGARITVPGMSVADVARELSERYRCHR
jgi:hypothetical protein